MKLAFYTYRGNWFNRLIRFWTKSGVSHVELVFSDGMSFSASVMEAILRTTPLNLPAGYQYWTPNI